MDFVVVFPGHFPAFLAARTAARPYARREMGAQRKFETYAGKTAAVRNPYAPLFLRQTATLRGSVTRIKRPAILVRRRF